MAPGWTLFGVALIVVGTAVGAPGLTLVGGLTLLSRWLITLWSRFGLQSITFERRIGTDRAVWGDQVPMEIEVWNRKLLPVPLLTADDHVTDTLRVVGHTLGPSERPGRGTLRNAWSLLWFERVVRRLTIEARRRGVFLFGPVRLTVSDLFDRGTRSEERDLPAELLVRPRSVPVRSMERAMAPLGSHQVPASLFTDPARFAGVRPYQRGDPIRRIHWRATARARTPVSRRYEPVRERQVLIAVDLQTVPGAYWLMVFDDEQVEALCVAASSLARRILRDGAACGLLLGTQLAGGRRWAYVPPTAAPGQLGRIDDVLARVQPIVSLPFETLLDAVPRVFVPGGSIVVLSARDPAPYLDAMRRLRGSGYTVDHVALGDAREVARDAARHAGVPSRIGILEPGWRDASALVLAD